jgi:methyltransferase family protein/methyltransferase FkbM-like protein
MEGNECYKFSTIHNFIKRTGEPPIERIVEVGVNVGGISLMMHDYFPSARIVGFEAVAEYCELARSRTAHVPQIELFHRAVTYDHLYADDLGACPRSVAAPLRIMKGLPCAGPGWLGGSVVVPADHEMTRRTGGVRGYELIADGVAPITIEEILDLTGFLEIDLLKIDCEGCEHSVLGCVPAETLRKIRFIAGEYHGLGRFYKVMRHKLFATHKVNLIGDAILGAFFAERLDGEKDGILRFNKENMLLPRPWLSEKSIDWHLFNEEFVLPAERPSHALSAGFGQNGAAAERSPVPLSFGEFVQKVIAEAEPMSQNTGPGDLGFGWIYYGLVRNLRPEYVVAIGSCRGFMPFCAARALQDNGNGKVLFIDPSYAGSGHPGWSGRGLWSDPAAVAARVASFGLTGWVKHFRQTSEEAFPFVREMVAGAGPGIVIIDGAHTHAQSLSDFELYCSLFDEGFGIFHDSTSQDCEVERTIETLRNRACPMITIHREVGLTIVGIPPAACVQEKWKHLCDPSDRGEKLLPFAHRLLRPGDRVLDAYCGCAPLTVGLKDVKIFGFDSDPQMIRFLQERYPQHAWKRIEELSLPFVALPEHIDVLLGLAVVRGHARWDPHHVLANARYLLGRYVPRACLFEAAAGYYDADILDDLEKTLTRLGYACQRHQIDTNLAIFARRQILLAERKSSGIANGHSDELLL